MEQTPSSTHDTGRKAWHSLACISMCYFLQMRGKENPNKTSNSHQRRIRHQSSHNFLWLKRALSSRQDHASHKGRRGWLHQHDLELLQKVRKRPALLPHTAEIYLLTALGKLIYSLIPQTLNFFSLHP